MTFDLHAVRVSALQENFVASATDLIQLLSPVDRIIIHYACISGNILREPEIQVFQVGIASTVLTAVRKR